MSTPLPLHRSIKRKLALHGAWLALSVSAASVHATTVTWNDAGPSNIWSTSAANWLPSSAWPDGNMAVFSGAGEIVEIEGTVVASGTVSIAAGLALQGGYTIADANANGILSLQGAGGGGGTSKPIISHAGSNTISANIVLSGSNNNNGRTITGSASASLLISGNISESEVAKSITLGGANSAVTLSGSNGFSGGVAFGNSNVTLNVNSTHALGTGALTVGSTVAPVTLGNTSGGNITLATSNAFNLTTTAAGTSSSNNVVYSSTNSLNLGNGAITFGGDPGDGRSISVSGAGALILDGNITETNVGTNFFKNGAGTLELGGVGAYTGNTTVSAGTLLLTSTSESRFVIQNSNSSNIFLGSGTVSFDGTFRLDITGLTDSTGTWNLVNAPLSESYGSNFGLAFTSGPVFTDNLDGTYSSGGWTFDTTSGNLTLVPEPSTSLLLGVGLMVVLARFRRLRRA